MKGRRTKVTKLKRRKKSTSVRRRASSSANLKKQLDQRTRDLTEALQQQAAASEVLRVISSSPGELGAVFQTILANAVRLCEAKFGVLFRFDGRFFHVAALLDAPPKLAEFARNQGPFLPEPGIALYRLWRTKQVVRSDDYAAEEIIGPAHRYGGARSLVAVPVFKQHDLAGAIIIYRQEVRPFTDKQIELVRNFAAQAIIAIENARLLNELRHRTDDLSEALEQQTATSEVLRVISSSSGELQPVFRAMLANAVRICDATFGNLLLREGDAFRMAAMHRAPPAWEELRRGEPLIHAGPNDVLARLVRTKRLQHVADIRTEQAYLEHEQAFVGLVEVAGARTLVTVPMLKDNELVGAIAIYRQEVRSFTDKQIELLQNFANQAVIAIEDARLLSELRESLQQQTATADVLKVISRSTFDLRAVLDTLVKSAAKLCRADRVAILLARDNAYYHVASYGFTSEQKDYMRQHSWQADRGSIGGRAVLEGRAVQVVDVKADPDFRLMQGPISKACARA